jgi:hypothetical protein
MSLICVVAALGLAAAMTPLYVSLCHSLTRVTARNAHRLVACQRGSAELERLRAARPLSSTVLPVPQLPRGREQITVTSGPSESLAKVTLTLNWDESGARSHAEWTTLMRK